METNKEKDQEKDQSKGKQASAETDITYNLDSEELRKGTITTMSDAISGTASADGSRVEAARENDESNNPQVDK
ncbi:MAG: hypothetical protein COW65_13865 [Cytophagales bacterium CG18_big_fil_WC_8_21_14_2_50_42_9]|nr:MAG: hypothetical protein COW65_13865 [Cytophagales bacterium CG18_big_fil_WC_8_21_14_2_50_42_9]